VLAFATPPKHRADHERLIGSPSSAHAAMLKAEAEQVSGRVMETASLAPTSIAGGPSGGPRGAKISSAGRGSMTPPASVQGALGSGGQPLDEATRRFMEPRFGHDFSQVRVHRGGTANQSARELNARAYTVGRQIVFGDGQFSARTGEGLRLIAHELTHVVQQADSSPEAPGATAGAAERVVIQRAPLPDADPAISSRRDRWRSTMPSMPQPMRRFRPATNSTGSPTQALR
jgi:hypothetical protein